MNLISEEIRAALASFHTVPSDNLSTYDELRYYKSSAKLISCYFTNILKQVETMEKENTKIRLELQDARMQLAKNNIVPNDIDVI